MTSQLIKSLYYVLDNPDFNKDCISGGQLKSKEWLVKKVEEYCPDLGIVFLCAGWYATLATMLFESNVLVTKIRSFDIDPKVWEIAEIFNTELVSNAWKFKASTQDIMDIDYTEHTYDTIKPGGEVTSVNREVPNTIVNTSCEHIENWSDWWNKIPKGKLCILQSNDYKELPEHINCVDNVDHFKSIAPMTTYLYGGDLILGKYTRYMIIGIK